MFLQVPLSEQDHWLCAFQWGQGDLEAEVKIYKTTVMIFVAACSPCCTEYVKNINACYSPKYKQAVINAIVSKHYVEDFVASFNYE